MDLTGSATGQRICTTPMVSKTDYTGPVSIRDDGDGTIETAEMRIVIDRAALSVTVIDTSHQPVLELTTIRPLHVAEDEQVLTIAPNTMRQVYGLGEQFIAPGQADGDWVGRVRSPGCQFGNAQVEFEDRKGCVGNAQFPVMYAVGGTDENYAMFFDHLPAQTWDFTDSPWRLETSGDPIRWYVMTGPDLPDLRKDYMELVGRPPVPPKKMFGLWISEFGYENWAELEDKLRTLRANHFPVDGFVLDLQWFGGVTSRSDASNMGSLSWDTANFPEPAKKMAELEQEHGIGIMVIEESYVSRGLPAHAAMQERGFLARKGDADEPVYLSTWFGAGGMVDWTNPAASDYWHDLKRQPLIEDGVLGHWTDLGEPEQFDANAWYYGFPEEDKHAQRDIHNIYNFRWTEGIHRGYARNNVGRRPFIMSRSGTSGIQRFGVSMWSGDIGSRLGQLAAHFNTQMHMSFSGVDYFGADIGGFQRWSLDGDLDEMYTQWFASGAAFDVPARPHTANNENTHQTAPDRIGDPQSNLENARQRYELVPYLYSLAHRAYLYGEPIVPPLAFYYQNDPNVREMGGQKMLGRDLLVAAVAAHGKTETDVYLPAGAWVNYHTNEWIESSGQWLRGVPLYLRGRFKLPVFARAGAIVPQMHVDEKTMNVTGRRIDGSRRDELIVRVYAHGTPSSFTLFEDDGETTAYQHGEVRTTVISQVQPDDGSVHVVIGPSRRSYRGAPDRRDNVVRLITDDLGTPSTVSLNDRLLPQHPTREAFEAAAGGWYDSGNHLVVAKSGETDVAARKAFAFDFAEGYMP